MRWTQAASVKAGEWWPSQTCTCFAFAPARKRQLAQGFGLLIRSAPVMCNTPAMEPTTEHPPVTWIVRGRRDRGERAQGNRHVADEHGLPACRPQMRGPWEALKDDEPLLFSRCRECTAGLANWPGDIYVRVPMDPPRSAEERAREEAALGEVASFLQARAADLQPSNPVAVHMTRAAERIVQALEARTWIEENVQ